MNSTSFQKKSIIVLSAAFLFFTGVSAQSNFNKTQNSHNIPEKQWIQYVNKANLLFEKVDKESFLNYVLIVNDGNMAEMPYFKKFVTEVWRKDKEELVYKIGTGLISNEQQLNSNFAALQPKYSNYYSDFKTKKDAIIESQNQQGRSPINGNPVPFNCGSPCTNPGFETGTTSFWDGSTGTACASPDPCTPVVGFNSSQHIITLLGAYDSIVGGSILPTVPPGGGNNALMLGNGPVNGAQAARISMSFTVSASTANFTYRFAAVLEDPVSGHTNPERPYFSAKIKDASGTLLSCGTYIVTADASQPNFTTLFTQTSAGSNIWYRNWTSVFVPLGAYIGQCITVEFTSSDCAQGGHFGYAYIDANCSPMQIITSAPTVCGGSSVTLNAPAGGGSYTWTNTAGGTTGIVGSDSSQTAIVNQAGTYQVVVASVSGTGCTSAFTITIGSSPNPPPVPQFTNNITCAGSSTQFTDASTPTGTITSWAWDFNNDGITDDASQNPSHVFTTAGTYPVVLTVSEGACAETITHNVTVTSGPVPVITDAGPFCNNSSPVNLTASITGCTWSGNGIIDDSLGIFDPAIATIGNSLITYITSGVCTGSNSISITVNPAPVAPTISANGANLSSSNCNGYQWYFNGSAIFGATSQTYTATQNGDYTVMSLDSNGCSTISLPYTYVITGIDEFSADNNILIFPNPNNGIFRIEMTDLKGSTLAIFNAIGEIIYQSTVVNPHTEIDLSNQPSGIYFVHVNGENLSAIKKIVLIGK